MQLGMSGLGRMGANVLRHVSDLVSEGATGATSLEEFVQKLSKPRAALVMVPAGMAVIEEAVPCDVSTLPFAAGAYLGGENPVWDEK